MRVHVRNSCACVCAREYVQLQLLLPDIPSTSLAMPLPHEEFDTSTFQKEEEEEFYMHVLSPLSGVARRIVCSNGLFWAVTLYTYIPAMFACTAYGMANLSASLQPGMRHDTAR